MVNIPADQPPSHHPRWDAISHGGGSGVRTQVLPSEHPPLIPLTQLAGAVRQVGEPPQVVRYAAQLRKYALSLGTTQTLATLPHTPLHCSLPLWAQGIEKGFDIVIDLDKEFDEIKKRRETGQQPKDWHDKIQHCVHPNPRMRSCVRTVASGVGRWDETPAPHPLYLDLSPPTFPNREPLSFWCR